MMTLGISSVVGLSFWSQPVSATSLAPLTQAQMTDASDSIVRGKVISVWTMTNPAGHIVTRALVQVTHSYKGSVAVGTVIPVDSPGGGYVGILSDVAAAARFSVDEDVFLFLATIYHGTAYTPVGMYLGKYTVRQNPVDGSEMPVRFTIPYTQDYDARFIPHPPAAERIRLEDMVKQVEDRVQAGWDGQPIPGVDPAHLREINRLAPGVK